MLAKLRQMKEDEGFTLVELLVVIAILGILAGIVVFSVAGITNNGQSAACSTEKATLTTAEEAYYAQNKSYVTDTVLKTSGFLATSPTLVRRHGHRRQVHRREERHRGQPLPLI